MTDRMSKGNDIEIPYLDYFIPGYRSKICDVKQCGNPASFRLLDSVNLCEEHETDQCKEFRKNIGENKNG